MISAKLLFRRLVRLRDILRTGSDEALRHDAEQRVRE